MVHQPFARKRDLSPQGLQTAVFPRKDAADGGWDNSLSEARQCGNLPAVDDLKVRLDTMAAWCTRRHSVTAYWEEDVPTSSCGAGSVCSMQYISLVHLPNPMLYAEQLQLTNLCASICPFFSRGYHAELKPLAEQI